MYGELLYMLNDEKGSRGQCNVGKNRGDVQKYRGGVREGKTSYKGQAESEGGGDD